MNADQETSFEYEKAVNQLESIIEDIEAGEGTFSDMIKLLEQGIQLVKECRSEILVCEEKIRSLLTELQDESHKERKS